MLLSEDLALQARCLACRGLVTQHQEVAYRQHVPFGRVLNVPRASVRTQQLERAFLFALLQKGTPAFRNQRLETGLGKIIQTAADDLFPRETQEFARADTGVPVLAIVVRDQDGRGRMENDRPEQQLEFFRAVFRQPAGGSWLRGRGVQSAFLLSAVDPEAVPGESKPWEGECR